MRFGGGSALILATSAEFERGGFVSRIGLIGVSSSFVEFVQLISVSGCDWGESREIAASGANPFGIEERFENVSVPVIDSRFWCRRTKFRPIKRERRVRIAARIGKRRGGDGSLSHPQPEETNNLLSQLPPPFVSQRPAPPCQFRLLRQKGE